MLREQTWVIMRGRLQEGFLEEVIPLEDKYSSVGTGRKRAVPGTGDCKKEIFFFPSELDELKVTERFQ